MPDTNSSRQSRVTRTRGILTDLSAVVRHAQRQNQYLSHPRSESHSPSHQSTPSTRIATASFKDSLRLPIRLSAASEPGHGSGRASRLAPTRIQPHFHILTIFAIPLGFLYLLWLGVRLVALILEGGCRALWTTAVASGRQWIARRDAAPAAENSRRSTDRPDQTTSSHFDAPLEEQVSAHGALTVGF